MVLDDPEADNYATLDHVIPKGPARRVKRLRRMLSIKCRRCNAAKGGEAPSWFSDRRVAGPLS
jgi:hypothetical protein